MNLEILHPKRSLRHCYEFYYLEAQCYLTLALHSMHCSSLSFCVLFVVERKDSVSYLFVVLDAFEIPDRVLNSALGRSDGNVYEALLEKARHSALNMRADGSKIDVPDFLEELRPYLDTDFLRLANKRLPIPQAKI